MKTNCVKYAIPFCQWEFKEALNSSLNNILYKIYIYKFIAFRLAVNIQTSANCSDSISTNELYEKYTNYCQASNNKPCKKDVMGKAFAKFFPNARILRRGGLQKKDGKTFRLLHYTNVCWFSRSINTELLQNFIIPEYCTILANNESLLEISIPTTYLLDGYVINKKITCYRSYNKWALSVNGNNVNLESLGINCDMQFTQHYVDTIISMVNMLPLCLGRPASSTELGTNVPADYSTIKTVHLARISDKENTNIHFFSNTCAGCLTLTAVGTVCSRCTKHVWNEASKLKKNCEILITSSPSNMEENAEQLHEENCTFPEINNLQHVMPDKASDLTSDELIDALINKLPNAPQDLKILLQSQVKNCSVSLHGRRWDSKIISVCLSLWTRSPQAYEDLLQKNILVFPSVRTLERYKNIIQQKPGFNTQNIDWMNEEACRQEVPPSGRKGGIILDEMSISQDIQVCI